MRVRGYAKLYASKMVRMFASARAVCWFRYWEHMQLQSNHLSIFQLSIIILLAWNDWLISTQLAHTTTTTTNAIYDCMQCFVWSTQLLLLLFDLLEITGMARPPLLHLTMLNHYRILFFLTMSIAMHKCLWVCVRIYSMFDLETSSSVLVKNFNCNFIWRRIHISAINDCHFAEVQA